MYVLTKEAQSQWTYNTTARQICLWSNTAIAYPTDCTTAGSAGGALKCFTTSLKDGKLTVNKS